MITPIFVWGDDIPLEIVEDPTITIEILNPKSGEIRIVTTGLSDGDKTVKIESINNPLQTYTETTDSVVDDLKIFTITIPILWGNGEYRITVTDELGESVSTTYTRSDPITLRAFPDIETSEEINFQLGVRNAIGKVTFEYNYNDGTENEIDEPIETVRGDVVFTLNVVKMDDSQRITVTVTDEQDRTSQINVQIPAREAVEVPDIVEDPILTPELIEEVIEEKQIIIPEIVKEETKKMGGGCSGDCTAPTFYKNKHGVEIVKGGFDFNYSPVDVTDYHTPYELITVNTNQTYHLTLKVFEKNLRFIQVGWGMPEIGAAFDNAEAVTTIYLNYDGTIKDVTTIDKHTLVDVVQYGITQGDCGYTEKCHVIDLDFIFREKQKANVIAIQAVDMERNSATHYINDGIAVSGSSMNDPPTHKLFNKHSNQQTENLWIDLTRIDRVNNIWEDDSGVQYTMDNGYYSKIIPDIFERYQDDINKVMKRTNSNWHNAIILANEKALSVFDSSGINNWTWD